MSNFINNIFSIILVFMMLVLAPLVVSYKSDDMLARREIMNETEMFIDKVKDSSTITEDDINKLYLDCNSHGMSVDVDVKRLIETSVYNEDKKAIDNNYFAVDDIESLSNINAGDIIQVSVKEVTTSNARSITYKALGIDEGPLTFTLAGVVG